MRAYITQSGSADKITRPTLLRHIRADGTPIQEQSSHPTNSPRDNSLNSRRDNNDKDSRGRGGNRDRSDRNRGGREVGAMLPLIETSIAGKVHPVLTSLRTSPATAVNPALTAHIVNVSYPYAPLRCISLHLPYLTRVHTLYIDRNIYLSSHHLSIYLFISLSIYL